LIVCTEARPFPTRRIGAAQTDENVNFIGAQRDGVKRDTGALPGLVTGLAPYHALIAFHLAARAGGT
jgi:hypothetical protein